MRDLFTEIDPLVLVPGVQKILCTFVLSLEFMIDLRNSLMECYCTSPCNAHELEEKLLLQTVLFKKWVTVNPSAWSDGHCPHAARSHSFVYISTS